MKKQNLELAKWEKNHMEPSHVCVRVVDDKIKKKIFSFFSGQITARSQTTKQKDDVQIGRNFINRKNVPLLPCHCCCFFGFRAKINLHVTHSLKLKNNNFYWLLTRHKNYMWKGSNGMVQVPKPSPSLTRIKGIFELQK